MTATELGYLDGVTSSIQTQLDAKQATIGDGDLSIAKTSGLQTALDAKATSNALTSGLAGKQDVITDGDLTIARTDGLQTALDAKQATVTGAATTIVSSDLTVSRALTSNGSGKVAVSDVTATELGYLDGVTSSIQTQLDAKQATIGDGDLSIAKTSGLQTALDAKATSNALTSGLAGKQDVITDGDLTIARTDGLQTALDAKQATVTGAATTLV